MGNATDKVIVENTAVIDYPYACKQFGYGMVINGATGTVKWAADLKLDTIEEKPNLSIIYRRTLSAILPNGYSVVYRYLTQDTAISTAYHRIVAISNKVYLFDSNGGFVRKDSIGNRNTGWYEMLQLTAGEKSNFFSAGLYNGFSVGNIVETRTFEVRKWDTSFAFVWKRNTDFDRMFPYFSSTHLTYRNNALSLLLQSGSEPSNATYAYFGADSLMPYLDNLYARMVDSANFFSGIVYFDLNENGRKDAGEPVAPNVLIGNMVGDTVFAATKPNGFYEVSKGLGTFQIKPLNLAAIYPNFTTSQPVSHSVSLNNYGNYILNRTFGLRKNAAITDGQINITTYGIARPGGTVQYRIVAQNTGTNNWGGAYQLSFDTAKLIYQNSQLAPSVIVPGRLTYTVNNLTPLQNVSNNLVFNLKTTVMQNDTIKLRVELFPSPGDGLLVNNMDSAISVVRSSFDPNMKEVFPFKELRYDSVVAGKQELDYTIHFQNVGSDTAFAVTILDTLDTKLDLSTFRLISSSHPVTINWAKANILGFYFPGIRLVDSITNEMQSHGFVRFKVKPVKSVSLTDIVRNNASIYFDYNSPIKTNTVLSGFSNSVITGITTPSNLGKGLWVGSNPVQGVLSFKITASNIYEKMRVNIFDANGRLVFITMRMARSGNLEEIDVSRLSKGVYYLELTGVKNRFVKKLVVQ